MEVAASPHVIRAAYGSVPLSVEAARAPGRGTAAMGQALGNVASVLDEQAMKMAHAKNTVDAAAARRELDAAKERFAVFQEQNADEDTWGPQAAKEMETAKKNIGAMKLAPVVQRQFEVETADFEQGFNFEVKHAAVKQRVQRFKARTYTLAEEYAGKGDTDYAELLIRDGIKVGYINQDEGEVKIRQLGEYAQKNQVVKLINDDPQKAIATLEDKTPTGRWRNADKLSEMDRMTYIRSAKNAMETRRAETAQKYGERIYNDQAEGIEKEIDLSVATGDLLPSQAKTLKKAALGKLDVDEQVEIAGRVWKEVASLDAADPDFKAKSLRLRGTLAALSPLVREPVERDLQELEKPSGGSNPRSYINEHIETLFKSGVFGDTTEVLGKAVSPAEYSAASEARFKLKTDFQRFLRENPKASAEEQLNFINSRVRNKASATAGTSILSSILGK